MGKVTKLETKVELERKIEIGGKTFEIVSNFRKSHALSKYRNKLRFGTDIEITEENKSVFLEISKIKESTSENGMPDISNLSPEATALLLKMADKTADIYEIDELIEIGKILTNITDTAEIEELYDKEVEMNGYDNLVSVILYGVQLVFMNVKDGLKEEKNPQVAE